MDSIQRCGRYICMAVLCLITGLVPCHSAPGAPQSITDDISHDQLTVTGRVVREDGTPPPFGVAIERDCGSGFKIESYAEISGYFSFQIGRGPLSNNLPSDTPTSDPSIWKMAMEKREAPPQFEINLCMLRARLPGHRSSVVQLSGDPSSTKLDVGRIVLSPSKKAKGATVSLTGLGVPKEAIKAMDRALQAMQKTNFDSAASYLNTALKIYPENAEAWYRLGYIYDHRQRYAEAEEAFHKAIAIEGNYLPPYLALASAAWRKQDWAQMLDWSAQCLKLDPLGFPEAYFLNSVALYRMNMLDAAEETARKGQQVDVAHRFARLYLLLAEILFMKNDISGSIREMRNYVRFAGNAPDAEAARAALKKREASINQPSVVSQH